MLSVLLPASLLSLGLAHAGAVDAPAVRLDVAEVRVDSVSLREVHLTVDTELTRTRWPAVVLRSVEYRLSAGDDVMAEGATDMEPVRLRKDHPRTVGLPVSLHTLAALGSLGDDAVNGKVDLRIVGQVRARVFFVPFSVPFDQRLVDVDLGRSQRR